MNSKAISKVVDGHHVPELTYRERIKAHYRTKGKVELTDADMVIIERCEIVSDILMAERANLSEAKRKIKEKFDFKHRAEVDRAIEDAQYLLGAMFKAEKNYQRLIQHNDIEYWMGIAKEQKDGYLAAEMMKLRQKLYQLDVEDAPEERDYFSIIHITQEFRPEEFKHALEPGWEQRIEEKKQGLLKQLGLSADDAESVDFEENNHE